MKFAKDSAVNTSVPLFDVSHTKEIISPRRQGVGQINVASAIENEVSFLYTPTNESTIALKEIGRSTTIDVTLTNHSDKDKTYTVNDFGGVYTQATDSNKEIYDTKIDKATLTTDNQAIKLNAGESKTVTFNLTLPFSFSEQQFVEGFIGFDGVDTPNLVIPYMGFFGTYSQDKTVDPLVFQEGHGAPTTSGFLVSNGNAILGMVKNEKGESVVDPDAMAISPKNNDGVQDFSMPYLFFNRNFSQAKYDIVDDKGETVKELYISKNGRKDYYNPGTGKWTTHAVSQAKWAGTSYNKKSGKEEQVPDGRYQYKVSVISQNDGSTQETYIPVTVDNTEPEIKHVEVSKTGTLLVEVTDNLSGVKPDMVALNVNGKNYKIALKKSSNKDKHNQQYESTQKISSVFSQGKNQVTLGVSDTAGNIATSSIVAQQGDKENVLIYNLSPNQTISQNTAGYNKETGSFTLTGSYKNDTVFYVDGIEVKTSDKGLFEVAVPITKDKTSISFTQDKEGTDLFGVLAVKVDLDAPVVEINDSSAGKINTTDSQYTLSGHISDAKEALLYNPKTEEKIPLTLDDGVFSKELSLIYGDNLYYVVAADEAGNQTTQPVVIHSSSATEIDENMIQFDNIESSLSVINTESTGYDKDNKTLTITGKLAYPVANFTLNGEKVSYDPTTLAFSYQMKNISTGSYRLTAYVQDDKLNQGKPVVNYGYTIWVDDTLPSLTLHNVEQQSDGRLVGFTNQNPYVVQATITDNLTGYDFSINNNHVYTDPSYTTFNESFFAKRPSVDVDYKVSLLPEATSKMTATLADLVGNKQTLDFDMNHHKDDAIPAPSLVNSDYKLTRKPIILSSSNETDVANHVGNFEKPNLYYSTDKEIWTVVPKDVSVSENGNYYFKYADKYGNESPVSAIKVDNIRTEVKALPTVSLSSYGGKEEKVTVTIGLTAEDTDTYLTYSLDNGKTWKEYKTAFDVTKDSVLQVKSVDTAGNESPILNENIVVKPKPIESKEASTQTEIENTDKKDGGTQTSSELEEKPSKKEELSKKETTSKEEKGKAEKDKTPPFENQEKDDKKLADKKETTQESQKRESSQLSQEPIGFISNETVKQTKNISSNQAQEGIKSLSKSLLPKTGESSNKKVVIIGILMLSLVSIVWFTKRKKEHQTK